MFDKYDPKNRNPAGVFTNKPGDPNVAGQQAWDPVYSLNGGTPTQDGANAGMGGNNFADLGYLGDSGNFSGSNGLNDQFLQNLGWTGGNPYESPFTQAGTDGAAAPAGGYTPEFQQFIKDKGLKFYQQSGPDGRMYLQAFGPDGQPVGTPFAQGNISDDAFGVAGLAAMGFAGAAAAGAGAAGGAANGSWDVLPAAAEGGGGAGGLAGTGFPEYAANPYAYGGTLTADAGAGIPAGSLGGETAALGGANGSWDVLPAASSGGGMLSSIGSGLSDVGSWLAKNPGVVNTLGGVASGLIGQYSAGQASDAARAAQAAADARLAPWYASGASALARNDALMANPSSIALDPAYQFRFNEGQRAATNLGASRGLAYSGAQDKALTRWGQGQASNELDKVFARNAQTAGLGANAALSSAGNSLSLGNVLGAADLYAGSNWQNQIGNALGQWNYSQYKKGPN